MDFKGKILKEIFVGSNDFRICAMCVDKDKYPNIIKNKYGEVIITGEMVKLDDNVEYYITATEVETKYGKQYKVSSIHRDKPSSESDIFQFLSGILTQTQAENLYMAYPNIIDMIIDNEEVDLSKVKGVKDKTFKKIKEKIIKNFGALDLVAKYGSVLSSNIINKLVVANGSSELADKRLRNDPYSALCGLSNIGFKTADAIIKNIKTKNEIEISLGNKPIMVFDEDDVLKSKYRCLACIKYILYENEEEGHTYITLDILKNKLSSLVPECFDKMVDCLLDDSIMYDRDNERVLLQDTFNKEKYVADKILKCISASNEIKKLSIENIEKYRHINDIELTDEQFSVLNMLCNNIITVLNGAAGSGKTSVMSAVIKMLEDNNLSYVLFAPTGKAAKVLKEYTGREASTIHRGLGYNPSLGWEFCEKNLLNCDFIIVDETSMVEIALFYRIFDAFDADKSRILFVGDDAQLPSVGCGNVLHDILSSNVVPTVTLHKIFRYNEGGLMTVATDIRYGKRYLNNIKSGITKFGNGDYYFINTTKESTVKGILNIYERLIKNGVLPTDIQVLTAMKPGELGCRVINSGIQNLINAENINTGNAFVINNISFYKNDIVIQTVNNYHAKKYNIFDQIDNDNLDDLEDERDEVFIANGETGRIIDVFKNYVTIDFDGNLVEYSYKDMDNVDLGYCITIHKSQGSSAKYIILSTPMQHIYMLNSNILYVGVTRTKKCCYHLGDINAINKTLYKKENFNRRTLLAQMLTGEY